MIFACLSQAVIISWAHVPAATGNSGCPQLPALLAGAGESSGAGQRWGHRPPQLCCPQAAGPTSTGSPQVLGDAKSGVARHRAGGWGGGSVKLGWGCPL